LRAFAEVATEDLEMVGDSFACRSGLAREVDEEDAADIQQHAKVVDMLAAERTRCTKVVPLDQSRVVEM
jgi:hypothetical protein